MKKYLFKLMIISIAVLLFCNPENISEIKNRTSTLFDSQFIQIEDGLNSLFTI